jgi:hypothetical protein
MNTLQPPACCPSHPWLLFTLSGLLLLKLSAVAQSEGFTYTTNQGTVTITAYLGSGGAVVVPGKLNGLAVTSIGESAFAESASLTSIVIPNSVSNIENNAFYYCINLASAIISNGVTRIGDNAFEGCYSLPKVTLPDSVTSIGNGAFYDCAGLVSLALPNSLTNLGNSAFGGCVGLVSITMGNRVTSIGGSAFAECARLTSVAIPQSVTALGNTVFYGCIGLLAINVDARNAFYSSVGGILFNKDQTVLIQCPGGKSGSYAIPGSVTSIGESAFWNCSRLTDIQIPNSVTNIGIGAFWKCTGLSGITIPASVISLGNYAFYDCTGLKGVYFQGNAPLLGDANVFQNATAAIVYYRVKTTGWGPTFGGRPTSLWLSQAQPAVGSFGIQTNQFAFTFTDANHQAIVIEACTNLSHPNWLPLETNLLTGDSLYFSDSEGIKHPARFYRLKAVQ